MLSVVTGYPSVVATRTTQLMAEHELTDRQIAARLGSCDEVSFAHRFRAITGAHPGSPRHAPAAAVTSAGP